MQQSRCSLADKRVVVQASRNTAKVSKSCFIDENSHNRLFDNDEVNEYINAQMKKESERLGKKNK